MEEITTYLIALVSGGAIWEGLKFFYPDIKRPIQARIDAKKSFYKNLDPILKSANEFYGKIESLSKEDFSTFIAPANSNSKKPEHNQNYICYLFAQFWAQLEYLRLESQYTSLSRINKGEELLKFIDTIESRKYRILDRSLQRIIGESLITEEKQKFRVLTLKEFLDGVNNPESTLSNWINYLKEVLNNTSDKEQRQIILRFGIIVTALMEHFDPKYKTVRQRSVYKNKLNPKSKRIIKEHLMKRYLSFVKKKDRYY